MERATCVLSGLPGSRSRHLGITRAIQIVRQSRYDRQISVRSVRLTGVVSVFGGRSPNFANWENLDAYPITVSFDKPRRRSSPGNRRQIQRCPPAFY
jgi:hypothetical protein